MKISPCPNCGGSDLYRSVETIAANSRFGGPHLLPNSSPGWCRVVVCKDCGLMRLFASTVDMQALGGRGWERVPETARGPLGL